jgi:hypothetical protein
MGMVREGMAWLCHACPLCAHGRRRPDSLLGRILHHPLHADHCPFWKAERARYGPPDPEAAGRTVKE